MSATIPRFGLDPEILAREAAPVVALLQEHLTRLNAAPVKPQLQPGDVAAQFHDEPPLTPTPLAAILDEFRTKLSPYITHWQHPRFFAYYPAATSIPAILSELLIAGLGSVGLQWSANPAATELECVVMDWIAQMLHAPADSPFLHTSRQGGGILQNTAGEGLVVIMVAARIRKHLELQYGVTSIQPSASELETMYWRDSSRLVVYMSDQTHFSGPKAVRVAGMRLHQIPAKLLADGNYGIDADDVKAAMARDRAQGLIPCALQLNSGATNTSGHDDLASFAGFAAAENIWLHVDAAYAGAALILPEFRQRSLTIQAIADSFNFNGSKWFLCGFDSGFLFVRDRRWLKLVYAASGDYLAQVSEEDVYNPELKDWSIPLGRRFRALRIWMVLEYFGVQGIQAYLREGITQADWLRAEIDQSKDFVQFVRTDLSLVCLALADTTPALTDAFLEHLEALSDHGRHFLLYPSQLRGQRFLRIALGGVETQMADVQILWQACHQALGQARGCTAAN